MTNFTRCANCLRKYAPVARIVCLCGAITVAAVPIADPLTEDGAPSSPPNWVAVSTATSPGSVTMYFGDPVTDVERQAPGPGFDSMLAAVPGDEQGVYRPLLWTTDDGFDKAPPELTAQLFIKKTT